MDKEDMDSILKCIIDALRTVESPRFFKTERGFQGRFACTLDNILTKEKLSSDDAIIEQEYQKRLNKHGIKLRPDLIIHVPVEVSCSDDSTENNFVVFEFKRKAGIKSSMGDFHKLDEYFSGLNYSLGIFVNVDSSQRHLNNYSGKFKEKIHEFCVYLNKDGVNVWHSYFRNGEVVELKEV